MYNVQEGCFNTERGSRFGAVVFGTVAILAVIYVVVYSIIMNHEHKAPEPNFEWSASFTRGTSLAQQIPPHSSTVVYTSLSSLWLGRLEEINFGRRPTFFKFRIIVSTETSGPCSIVTRFRVTLT